MDFFLKNFLESAFPWAYANLQTTLIYAHADTEQKRKAIELAEHSGSPMRKKTSTDRYTVSDEETLKKLYGLL